LGLVSNFTTKLVLNMVVANCESTGTVFLVRLGLGLSLGLEFGLGLGNTY